MESKLFLNSLKKEAFLYFNNKKLKLFLNSLKKKAFLNEDDKADVINKYIEKKADSITPEQFLEIFEAAAFTNDILKANVIKKYIERKTNPITYEQFLKIFEAAEFDKDDNEANATYQCTAFAKDDSKAKFINKYIEKKANSITPEQFLEIFKKAFFTRNYSKVNVINKYIERKTNPITYEEFLEIFEAAEFDNDIYKIICIDNYIDKTKTRITHEEFLKIFEKDVFTENQKFRMIQIYLSKYNEQEQDQYFNNLLRILSSNQIGNLKYRVDLICDTLKERYQPYTTNQTAESLSDLANELYPNEHLRIELFKQAIDKNLINKDNIQSLKLNNIESNDLLLDFLTYAQSKIQEIDELDILKLTKSRYHSRYESLSNLLKYASPEDVFSQDSMEQINGIFNGNIQEFKALDILSYFDAKGRVEDFHSMLQESFKQDIRNKFKPSKDQLLISEEELGKIAKLTGDESVKDQFFKVGDLCQYIKDKVGELPELKENFKINFDNIEYINTETKGKIQEASQKAFKSDADDNNIIGFLGLIIDPNNANNLAITDTNKGKLLRFFRQSKASISQLLQKEGGLGKFIATLYTISDGCSANIGSQFHIALYDCLLQDERDAALYQILSQDIIPAILNRGGGDIIGSQSNPLDNAKVKECHYSPEALFNKIAKVFYDQREKKISRNATNLIKDEYGDEAHEIIRLLIEGDNSNFDQNAAQIAAYLTLSHSGLIPIDRLNSIFDSNISPGLKDNEELRQKLKKATLKSPDANPTLYTGQETGNKSCCIIF